VQLSLRYHPSHATQGPFDNPLRPQPQRFSTPITSYPRLQGFRSWTNAIGNPILLPRRAEKCQGISANALGFAGTFLVRDREELARLTEKGPMAVLEAVRVPPGFPESG